MSDPPSPIFGEACQGLELVCKEIWGYDAAVLSRALVTVNEARLASKYYWKTICLSAVPAFVNMLDLHCHIIVGSVDSVFVVKLILSILSGILMSKEVAMEILAHQHLMNLLSRYTMLTNGFASRQVIDTTSPHHRKPEEICDYRGDDVDMQRLAINCVKSISSIPQCRASFLTAGGATPLFDSLVEYMESFYASKTLEGDGEMEEGEGTSHTAEGSIAEPVTCLMPKQEPTSAADSDLPNVDLLSTLIGTLYFLCCERSQALREGLHRAGIKGPQDTGAAKAIIHFLLEVWSRNVDALSSRIVAIFIRLGVVPKNGDREENELSSQPWSTLVSSQQVYFLFDMIGYQNVSADAQLGHKLDDGSLFASQAMACTCLRQVLPVSLACREAVVNTCQHRLVDDPRGQTHAAPNMMLLLEAFAPQFPSAALCLADIFAWQEVNYRYSICLNLSLSKQFMRQLHAALHIKQVHLGPLCAEYCARPHCGRPGGVSMCCSEDIQCWHITQ